MKLVHAKIVQDDCSECRAKLIAIANTLGLPLKGVVVIIPDHWLNSVCLHGHPGLKFERVLADTDALLREAEQSQSGEIELEAPDYSMDATKDIGYPVREHGPYGSRPMHDDFNDESSPDGPGTY